MDKIKINMLSSADKIDGQGVGSAYKEQVKLVQEGAADIFDVYVNENVEADIIHHHTIDLGNYFKMRMNKGIQVAYVHFLPHTLEGSISLPRGMFAAFKKYVVEFYKSADYLIVVNPIFIEELVKYGIPKEKVIYIPNYVSKDEFYQKDKSEVNQLRKKFNVSEDDFVVMGVGQVQTRKGVKDFVEIAKSLPNIKFIWCGGFSFGRITDGYDELKTMLENPPKNMQFVGIIPREEMNDIYNVADILFMPSYNELFPMAILEAVNAHKPLLLRDLDLYEDILFHKYATGKNNDDFISWIKKLHEDAETYEKYACYAKEISEYYSKEHVLEMWKDFYLSIYKQRDIIMEERKANKIIQKERMKQQKSVEKQAKIQNKHNKNLKSKGR